MYKLIYIPVITLLLFACNEQKKKEKNHDYNKREGFITRITLQSGVSYKTPYKMNKHEALQYAGSMTKKEKGIFGTWTTYFSKPFSDDTPIVYKKEINLMISDSGLIAEIQNTSLVKTTRMGRGRYYDKHIYNIKTKDSIGFDLIEHPDNASLLISNDTFLYYYENQELCETLTVHWKKSNPSQYYDPEVLLGKHIVPKGTKPQEHGSFHYD